MHTDEIDNKLKSEAHVALNDAKEFSNELLQQLQLDNMEQFNSIFADEIYAIKKASDLICFSSIGKMEVMIRGFSRSGIFPNICKGARQALLDITKKEKEIHDWYNKLQ